MFAKSQDAFAPKVNILFFFIFPCCSIWLLHISTIVTVVIVRSVNSVSELGGDLTISSEYIGNECGGLPDEEKEVQHSLAFSSSGGARANLPRLEINTPRLSPLLHLAWFVHL